MISDVTITSLRQCANTLLNKTTRRMACEELFHYAMAWAELAKPENVLALIERLDAAEARIAAQRTEIDKLTMANETARRLGRWNHF